MIRPMLGPVAPVVPRGSAVIELPRRRRGSPGRTTLVLLAGLLLALASGCKEQKTAPVATGPVLDSNTVAIVGRQVIGADQFRREVQRRGSSLTKEQKEAMLESLIRTETVYEKAVAAGLDRDPEMQARIRRIIATTYEEKQRAKLKPATAGSAEVEAYYKANTAEFMQPESIRVAGIFVRLSRKAEPAKKDEARARVEKILADAKQDPAKPTTFGDLARQHSEDQATRYQGGDNGPMSLGAVQQRWGREIATNILTLRQPGEFSGVVEAPDGLWIFKLMERQSAAPKPLAQVRELIAYRLTKTDEMRIEREFAEQMKSGLRIEINRPLVDSIVPPAASTEPPPALPGN